MIVRPLNSSLTVCWTSSNDLAIIIHISYEVPLMHHLPTIGALQITWTDSADRGEVFRDRPRLFHIGVENDMPKEVDD